jgi:hypothetical protein
MVTSKRNSVSGSGVDRRLGPAERNSGALKTHAIAINPMLCRAALAETGKLEGDGSLPAFSDIALDLGK